MLTPNLLQAALEQSDGPKSLLLNYPSNPTGRSFSKPDLGAIADLAREYRLLIISDEIYGDLHHTGTHSSIAELYPEGTIVSAGLSKWCGAGGWRLGTFAFPRELSQLLDSMAAVASETFTATSAPIQYAAVTAYERGPEIREYLRNAQHFLKALGNHLASMLRSNGLSVPQPEGGFYLFVGFDDHRLLLNNIGIEDSDQLAARILKETGVAMLPGSAFGCAPHDLVLRLSYVDFDGERALREISQLPEGEDVIVGLLKRAAPRVLEGASRIASWLNESVVSENLLRIH